MGFITKIYQVIPTNNLNCISSAVLTTKFCHMTGAELLPSSLVGRPRHHERQLHLQKIFQSVQCAPQTLCLLVYKPHEFHECYRCITYKPQWRGHHLVWTLIEPMPWTALNSSQCRKIATQPTNSCDDSSEHITKQLPRPFAFSGYHRVPSLHLCALCIGKNFDTSSLIFPPWPKFDDFWLRPQLSQAHPH